MRYLERAGTVSGGRLRIGNGAAIHGGSLHSYGERRKQPGQVAWSGLCARLPQSANEAATFPVKPVRIGDVVKAAAGAASGGSNDEE